MNFQFDQNTVILGLVVIFIAWYFYQESKESFRSKRGVQARRTTVRLGKPSPQILITPPAPAPAPAPVPAPAPAPAIVVEQPLSPQYELGDDFAGLL